MPAPAPSPATPPAPLRIGFVGVAGIAKTHMKHLQPVPNVELSAICDISADVLAKTGDEYKIARRFTDYKAMLREKDLDAISVCTPNGLHAPQTIAALEAGKHVIVEKPMAMTVAEAEAMCAAAKASGRHLVVGFQWRFGAKAVYLRKQVEAGVFGRLQYVRVQALRRRGIPSWGVFTDKAKQGGGALIDIGVHILEMTHAIIGKPRPTTASAAAYTAIGNRAPEVACPWGPWKHENYTVEDLAMGFLRFDSGVSMSVETSFATHIEKDVWNIQIIGEKAGATFEPLQLFTDQGGYMVNTTPHFIGNQDGFVEKMKHFAEVCRGERANECPGEDGLAIQRILNGLYDSAAKGREVAL